MKAYVYTIEDDYLGILLTIEGEVITFSDEICPDVIINEISYGDKTLELWPFSDRFLGYLKDRIYREWCKEARRA